MNRKLSTVQHVQRRPQAVGVLRRAVAALVSLSWIIGSLVCPVPALAHDAFAQAGHPAAPTTHGHHTHGGRHGNDQSDLCCDILGQVDAAADSLTDQLHYTHTPDHAPLPVDGFKLVAAAVTDEAISLQMHGPEPPRLSWPQFTKVWSQAPPADRV